VLPWTRAWYGYRLDPDRLRDPAGVRVEAAVVRELFATDIEEGVGPLGLAKGLSRPCTLELGKGAEHPDQSQLHWPGLHRVHAGAAPTHPPLGHPLSRPSEHHPRPSAVRGPGPGGDYFCAGSLDQFEQVQVKLGRNLRWLESSARALPG